MPSMCWLCFLTCIDNAVCCVAACCDVWTFHSSSSLVLFPLFLIVDINTCIFGADFGNRANGYSSGDEGHLAMLPKSIRSDDKHPFPRWGSKNAEFGTHLVIIKTQLCTSSLADRACEPTRTSALRSKDGYVLKQDVLCVPPGCPLFLVFTSFQLQKSICNFDASVGCGFFFNWAFCFDVVQSSVIQFEQIRVWVGL